MTYQVLLGLIGVGWPIIWAVWNYRKDHKVKISIVDFGIQYTRSEENLIDGIELTIGLHNYGDQSLGVLEAWITSKFNDNPFYLPDDGPLFLKANNTLSFKMAITDKNDIVKSIQFFLVDERKYCINKKMLKFINRSIKNIGTSDGLSLKVTK